MKMRQPKSCYSIKDSIMNLLVKYVPVIIKSFDKHTGRFLIGNRWGITNQDLIYPLALLYKTKSPKNPFFRDPHLFEAALLGGDCIRRLQYDDGRVEFIKPDGSRWGAIYMPWTMYHWLETYILLKEDLDDERMFEWLRGLNLALNGMKREVEKSPVHNITVWKAMTLFRAGLAFKRRDFLIPGQKMIYKALKVQDKCGFWPEYGGPSPHYNLIYIHSLGLYYEFSGDRTVLPYLYRALRFQIYFTYPDGTTVETIDGRTKYNPSISVLGLAAFTLFPEGRRFVHFLLSRMEKKQRYYNCFNPALATAYVHSHDGVMHGIPQDKRFYYKRLLNDKALVSRYSSWFYCLSGITTKPTGNRWGMDRQNYISIWNEKSGLIVGGGNSKNQPELSSFIIQNKRKLLYIADDSTINVFNGYGGVLDLYYNGIHCSIKVLPLNEKELVLEYSLSKFPTTSSFKALFNLILKVTPGEVLKIHPNLHEKLTEESIDLKGVSGWIMHRNWKIKFDKKLSLKWPVKPFNPYNKNGEAPLSMAVCTLSGDLRKDDNVRIHIIIN
ncbi:hypothetical protein CW702_02535 [Candidatus Bathyarchaeota archaeon]|nr:MAG: hypothetical protein CW702_02535 [Candidatus Bathyarchaeota archaeon]